MELKELRKEIDSIDRELTALFIKRMGISADIAEYKRKNGLPILDADRERELLDKIADISGEELSEYSVELYRTVIELSKSFQSKKMSDKNKRCGLIGEHLTHSFSAIIHKELSDYSYGLFELEPNKVGEFVKSGELDAFNVTIPYKKAVMPFLDRISDKARRIGAVNTVVRREDGSLDGYNTDYFGFDRMITASGIEVKGKKVIVLGSGGASLTVQTVLADRGAKEITVIGRSLENNYNNIARNYDAEVIVNTTPVGMYPGNGDRPIILENFKKCEGVLDLIYNPAKTALLLDAEKLGIPHMNGLYMLVAQAVRAYELFTDRVAEENIIENTVKKIERDTKNIVLVGMPGCGKSTVGKILAEMLGREFYDADVEFEKMHRMTPADAINTLGESDFRHMETETLKALCKESGKVIACGGGAVTREENYPIIRQNGTVIYLKRELSMLATKGRPLSLKRNVEELYLERREAYERFSHLAVESTEKPRNTAEQMLLSLGYTEEKI